MNYIFYSWQSDSPAKDNRHLISKALRKVADRMKKKHPVEIVQASGRELGTTDIPSSIFRNIDCSDFFVCDLTCMFKTNTKKSPNPNVMLELGYASSVMGWDRIICVINEDYSGYGDLPFDLRNRRIVTYSKNKEKQLQQELLEILSKTQERIGQLVQLSISHSTNTELVDNFSLSDIEDKITSDDINTYARDDINGQLPNVLIYALLGSILKVYPNNENADTCFYQVFQPYISNPYEDPQKEIDDSILKYRTHKSKRYLELKWRNISDHIDSCLITIRIKKDPRIVLFNDSQGEGTLIEEKDVYVIRAKANNIFPGESLLISKLNLIYKSNIELYISSSFVRSNGFKKIYTYREKVTVDNVEVSKDDFFSYWID